MKEHNQRGIFFSFSGPVSQFIMSEIVDILKHKMSVEEASTTAIYNVFSVVVELLQNINNYSARRTVTGNNEDRNDKEEDLGLGMIFAGLQDDDYFVLSGNPIENNKIENLKEKLVKIQRMDKKELRRYYKEKLRSETDEGSKGAGLGLIEVARKTSQPIQFDFQSIDNDYSFFSLTIFIGRE